MAAELKHIFAQIPSKLNLVLKTNSCSFGECERNASGRVVLTFKIYKSNILIVRTRHLHGAKFTRWKSRPSLAALWSACLRSESTVSSIAGAEPCSNEGKRLCFSTCKMMYHVI